MHPLACLSSAEMTEIAALKASLRDEVIAWLKALGELNAATPWGGRVAAAETIAARFGVSLGTVYRKAAAFEAQGWRGLVPGNTKAGGAGKSQAFKDWVTALFITHQRDMTGETVAKAVLDQWSLWHRTGDPRHAIPGFTAPPAPGRKGYPAGFSAKQLKRYRPDSYAARLARQGEKAASCFLPSILRTRVGTAFGQVVFFDDQDYDCKVVAPGHSGRALRPQGFNCLDYHSGAFLDWTMRLRWWDAGTEKYRTLTQVEFVWFVVNYLTEWGYRADETGTVLVMEHGTASGFSNQSLTTAGGCHDFDSALAMATGGKVAVERSGLFNSPVFAGMLFRPQSAGNFRFKSPLEGMFNLVRNRMAALPGPTGLSAAMKPEEQYGLDKYCETLLKVWDRLDDAHRQLLQFPVYQLHELARVTDLIYRGINARTDHALEGWQALGYVAPQLRLDPEGPWRTLDEVRTLPPQTQQLALSLLDQPGFCRNIALPPAAIVAARRAELTKLPPAAVPLLIPMEWAKRAKVKANRTIVIQDQLCGPEAFTYTARIETRHGAETLRPDLSVLAYFNPHRPDTLALCDMDGRYIGTIAATSRAPFLDREAIELRLGERAALKADLDAPVRAALAGTMDERQAMRDTNARLRDGLPVTSEERSTAAAAVRTDRSAAAFGRAAVKAAPARTAPQETEPDEDWSDTLPTQPNNQPTAIESW
jgi:hypothetical protein